MIVMVLIFGSTMLVSAQGNTGTRENPIPFGQTGMIGDLEVSLVSFNADAYSAMKRREAQNEPAEHGSVLILAKVKVTYHGNDVQRPDLLRYQFVGPSNAALPAVPCITFGDSIHDEAQYADLFPGGSSQFEICLQAPKAELSGLLFYASDVNGNRVFFSLEVSATNATPLATPR